MQMLSPFTMNCLDELFDMTGWDSISSHEDAFVLRALSSYSQDVLTRRFLGDFEVSSKDSRTDYVSSVDKEIERGIREILGRYRPEDRVLGEEEGADGHSSRCWIVDPLDGTANFVRGRPNWCSSIALEVDGKVVLGAVSEPLAHRIFLAKKGTGAWVIDEAGRETRLWAAQTSSLEDSVGSTGFSNDPVLRRGQALFLARLSEYVLDLRQYGSAALDFCHVADGSQDFYCEAGLDVWDSAAGALIAEEAGASLFNVEGTLVTCSPTIQVQLAEAIRNSSEG